MAILDIFKKEKKAEIPSKKEIVEKKPSQVKKATPKAKKEKTAMKPGVVRIDAGGKGGEAISSIILRPRITEKTSFLVGDGVYTFAVHPRANKIQIKRAITEIFGVTPLRVNIITTKPRKVVVRGRRGKKSGSKKALVYLKEGDKIEFV